MQGVTSISILNFFQDQLVCHFVQQAIIVKKIHSYLVLRIIMHSFFFHKRLEWFMIQYRQNLAYLQQLIFAIFFNAIIFYIICSNSKLQIKKFRFMSKNTISSQQLFLIALEDFIIKAKDLENVIRAISNIQSQRLEYQLYQDRIISLKQLLKLSSINNHQQFYILEIEDYLRLKVKQYSTIEDWLNNLYFSAVSYDSNIDAYPTKLNYKQVIYQLILNCNSLVKAKRLLLTTVWKHQHNLQLYFSDSYNQDCVKGISFCTLKQFMYDKGFYNRYYINLLKKYLFSASQILIWQSQAHMQIEKTMKIKKITESYPQNKSFKSYSFQSKRETPKKTVQFKISNKRQTIEQILEQMNRISQQIAKKRMENRSNKNLFSRKRIVSEPKTPYFKKKNNTLNNTLMAIDLNIVQQPFKKCTQNTRKLLCDSEYQFDKQSLNNNNTKRRIQLLQQAEQKAKLKIKQIQKKALSKVHSTNNKNYQCQGFQNYEKKIFKGKMTNFGQTWNKFACIRREDKLKL